MRIRVKENKFVIAKNNDKKEKISTFDDLKEIEKKLEKLNEGN